MRHFLSYIFLIGFLLCQGNIHATTGDTIPPVFTTPPSDLTINCHSNLNTALADWLNNHAGAVADNGEAEIQNSLTVMQAQDSLQNILNTGCSSTGNLEVGFFAIDSCNNLSDDTLTASFIVVDNTRPQLTSPGLDVTFHCTYGILDSLQEWLDNIAFAKFEDNCSDSIHYTNYNWMDSDGNSGFADPATPTNIVIGRNNCLWSVQLTFFVEDECGNISTASAEFSLSGDTIPPDIILAPADTTLLCSQTIDLNNATFTDGCDANITPNYIETNNRGSDSQSCDFYNYEIFRSWEASDACGNVAGYDQTVMIRDTLAPFANFQPVVAIDCSEDVNDIDEFIEYGDDCLLETFSYSDSIILSSQCQTQILRNYYLQDICENESAFSQNIQIRDFRKPVFEVKPRDTIVHCSSADLVETFNNWRDDMAKAVVTDLCNEVRLKAVHPDDYKDTLSVFNAPVVEFNVPTCQPMTFRGILGFQIVEFVAYDACGNLISNRASFTAIDTVAPVIDQCPPDKTVVLKPNQCDTTIQIVIPSITDNCTPNDIDRWKLVLNGEENVSFTNDTFEYKLLSGFNELLYTFKDCADNPASCSQVIEIRDIVPPVLICPEETTVYLPPDNCAFDHTLEEIRDYLEVCSAPVDFEMQLPPDNAFVDFVYQSQEDIYKAGDKLVSFKNLFVNGKPYHPQLRLEYKLNISPNSLVTLESELGDILFQIDSASCNANTITLPLNPTQFNFWMTDNTVNFTINYRDGTGQGVLPCNNSNLQGSIAQDNRSYFRLILSYADIDPEIIMYDVPSGDTLDLTGNNVTLPPSEYILEYAAEDAFGNIGKCLTRLTAIDTTGPDISCKNIIVDATIQSNPFYTLNPNNLLQSISDNCAVDSIFLSQNIYSCTDIGKSLNVQLSAVDIYGNLRSCTSIVTVRGASLKPGFQSNLCLADSLRLLSFVDPSIVSSYKWTGPDGFSSNESDPLILSIDDSNSGIYLLEIVTDDGCIFRGSLNITVNQFSNPQITSDTTAYCVGEDVILNASGFPGNVSYLWYEGISPNGVLIAETQTPTLSINPTSGKHFYYVQLRSDECTSNFSSTKTIDILPVPLAIVDEPFISVCEGEDISLSTAIFGSTFNYLWTGPNGYFSRERIPAVIRNAELSDAGNYYLLIDNGICSSDTAVAQVVVFKTPARPIISGKTTFCHNESAVLTVSNVPDGDKYYWYKNGSPFMTGASNSLVLSGVSQSEEGDYTVVVEEGFCRSDTSAVFELKVENVLTIGASNNGPACEDEMVTLTSSFIPNASYVWEDPAGMPYIGREITVPAIQGIYTVLVTSENNCTASSSTSVLVETKPEITALSNTSSDCMSEDMSFSLVSTVFPAGNYEYEWSGPDMFASTEAMPVITGLSEAKAGEYTLRVILNDCASDPVSTFADFTLIPSRPEIQEPLTFCEGEPLVLRIINGDSSSFSEYLWTTPTGLISTKLPQLSIDSLTNDFEGEISVLHIFNGCRSEVSAPVRIDPVKIPGKPLITTAGAFCETEKIILTTGHIQGAEYIWYTPVDTLITTVPSLEIENPESAYEGNYRVQIIVSGCNSPLSDARFVELLQAPPAPVFEQDSIKICLNDPDALIICVSSPADTSIRTLQLIDIETDEIIAEQTDECFDISALVANGENNYTLGIRSVSDSCPSAINSTLYLEIVELPETGAVINENNSIVCDRDFIELSATIPENVDVEWKSTDPSITIFNETSANPRIDGLEEGTNTIILESHLGQCRGFYHDTIYLETLNRIIAQDDSFDDEFQGTIDIDPLFNDVFESEVIITNVSQPTIGVVSHSDNRVSYTPPRNFAGSVMVEYTICYTLCPEVCASATINFILGDNLDCFASNVVTPNGDGYNDAFVIPCLNSGNYPSNELKIFNQWGNEIFSAAPYNNDWQGTFDGEALPVGTYFYVLDLGEGDNMLHGFIVLEL